MQSAVSNWIIASNSNSNNSDNIEITAMTIKVTLIQAPALRQA